MEIWSILQPFGIFYGYLVIWHIFPVLVCCTGKNLATLIESESGWVEKERFAVLFQGRNRVARFFCKQFTKTGKNVPNYLKITN
jgi:hypothetical protein